jgi:hypothetical protein
LAQSNIDPDHKFAWGENIGWTNWRDANGTADGVVVDAAFLFGFIWGENVGWVNVGDGTPADGLHYANVNGTDFGVNLDCNSDLYGFAWGENIGWINFDTRSKAPNQARYDDVAGRFRGFAWTENRGWINLDDATHFVGADTADICFSGATCGNGLCEAGDGEDCVSCPDDCNGQQSGNPNNRFCCGDGDGENPVDCTDERCTSGGFACTDDPVCCGDGTCEGSEDGCCCEVDCGAPPANEIPGSTCNDGLDNDCDGLIDCDDPDCPCGGPGAACTVDCDCCSNQCKGNGTCK